VWAWVFTIPASAILAASAALLVRSGLLAVTFVILILGAGLLVLLVRRSKPKRPAGK
jgi:hypothetical protein